MIGFGVPAWIIFIRLWILRDAPLLDSIIIICAFLFTALLSTYFLCKIIAFAISWCYISHAREMNTEAIVSKSFLNTRLTIDELETGNNSFDRNFSGFELEQSRTFIQKIVMSTRRAVATNRNHVEINVFRDIYTIKTKMTDKELLQDNMFREGQSYKLYEYHKKLFIEKNKIIYRLKKGKLNINNYNNWLSCNQTA